MNPTPSPSTLSCVLLLHHLKVSLLFAFSNYQGVTTSTTSHHHHPFPSDMLNILGGKKCISFVFRVCWINYHPHFFFLALSSAGLIQCKHCNFTFCCTFTICWTSRHAIILKQHCPLVASECFTALKASPLSENGLWQSNLLLSQSLWPNMSSPTWPNDRHPRSHSIYSILQTVAAAAQQASPFHFCQISFITYHQIRDRGRINHNGIC